MHTATSSRSGSSAYLMTKEVASWITFKESRPKLIINTQNHSNCQNQRRKGEIGR